MNSVNSKSQILNSKQILNPKFKFLKPYFEFGILEFWICLGFGAWDLEFNKRVRS